MIIKSLIGKYRERYSIPEIELADFAETNRFHSLVVSPILLVFGLIDFIAIFISNRDNLTQHLFSLFYFAIFVLASLSAFVLSKKSKSASREKAYRKKTFPFYILFFSIMGTSVYNFYILDQPFNGVLSYCMTGLISLCAFSFSPIPFFIGLILATAAMYPGIYQNFGLSGLADMAVLSLLLFYFSLFKKHTENKYLIMLKKQKNTLEARTFGNFTLLYDGKVVKFSRTKSLEILGYLILKNGSSVKTKELISVLWGDHADSSRYGNNLRNLIIDIKQKLSALGIQNFFITEYNNFRINPEAIKCDYYDFLSGDKKAINKFAGEFMSQFSWAENEISFLEKRALKNNLKK